MSQGSEAAERCLVDAGLGELVAMVSSAVREAYEMGRRDAAQLAVAAIMNGSPPPRPIQLPSGRAAPGSIKAIARAALARNPAGVTERQMRAEMPNLKRPSLQMAFRSLVADGEAEQIAPATWRKKTP